MCSDIPLLRSSSTCTIASGRYPRRNISLMTNQTASDRSPFGALSLIACSNSSASRPAAFFFGFFFGFFLPVFLWKRIERIAHIVEPQQPGLACDAPFLALLRIGQVGGARQAQDAVDVLRAGLGSEPLHQAAIARLDVVDLRLVFG